MIIENGGLPVFLGAMGAAVGAVRGRIHRSRWSKRAAATDGAGRSPPPTEGRSEPAAGCVTESAQRRADVGIGPYGRRGLRRGVVTPPYGGKAGECVVMARRGRRAVRGTGDADCHVASLLAMTVSKPLSFRGGPEGRRGNPFHFQRGTARRGRRAVRVQGGWCVVAARRVVVPYGCKAGGAL